MAEQDAAQPDNTAVRVALWRSLHVQLDDAPHVLEDVTGLQLVAPDAGWQQRPDMHPLRTRHSRASIVARARFVEDLVVEQAALGVTQYVILGAGLDTFAQRRTDLAKQVRVFEVEQPATQAWKRQRLMALGLPLPVLVPVDFEQNDAWRAQLVHAGFDAHAPAVVASTGVAMYLHKEAVTAMLREAASLARGSTFVMSFMLPLELVAAEERPGIEAAARGARANGTPFLSFFAPDELVTLARDAGFKTVRHVSAKQLTERYFSDRTDGLRPSSGEELLVTSP